MNEINLRKFHIRDLDTIGRRESWIYRIHPLAKLLVTCCYIVTIASFDKYDLLGLLLMAIYPIALFAVCGIPYSQFFYRARFVLPFVCAVGLFNPFFDKTILIGLQFRSGVIYITGGVISFITLMLKGLLCLMASFILIVTTSIDQICAALRKIGVPQVITSLIMLTWRYIHVLMDELSVMMVAYSLRAPGQKGIAFPAWGSFLGNLLLRSMDRAEQIYSSMEMRGFRGDFRYACGGKLKKRDYVVILIGAIFFLSVRCRIYDIF